MTEMRSFLYRLSMALVLVLLVGCGPSAEKATFQFEAMGTVAGCDLELPSSLSRDSAQTMISALYDSVNTVFSIWQENTELSRLNRAPADSAISLSPWLKECLMQAKEIHKVSEGAFDPTAEPLLRLWGFYQRAGRLPSANEIDGARAAMGRWDFDEEGRVVKKSGETRFDLGAIAKGLALDLAVARLQSAGVENGLVDLGGNLFCLGGASGRDDWRVGVKDPLNKARYFATVNVTGLAVATSGSYERFVTIDGKRYGHIMNPATGRPSEGVLGVTVLAPTAQLADGLSTALFVMGPVAGKQLLGALTEKVSVIMVVPGEANNPDRVLVTPDLGNRVKVLPEYASQYHLEVWH